MKPPFVDLPDVPGRAEDLSVSFILIEYFEISSKRGR
jgi:hypothetical protein